MDSVRRRPSTAILPRWGGLAVCGRFAAEGSGPIGVLSALP